MTPNVARASLLNSYTATPLTVDASTNPNVYRISGLMPIDKGDVVSVTVQAAVAEVQQVYTVGQAVVPTVTSGTRYQLTVGNTDVRREGYSSVPQFINYTAPDTLTGTAATDRDLMYKQMASEINANAATWATGYRLQTITHDAGTLGVTAWVAGETLTAPSGASALVVSGNLAGAGATVVAMTTTTDFTAAELVTSSGGGTATTNAATVIGVGLRIVDKSGYHYPGTTRGGANQVQLTDGFTLPSTMLVLTTAGVISYGQAAYLTLDIPVLDKTGNLSKGTWDMATNNAPTSGKAYGKVTIISRAQNRDGSLGNTTSGQTITQVLYLENSDADYANAITQLLTMNNNAA